LLSVQLTALESVRNEKSAPPKFASFAALTLLPHPRVLTWVRARSLVRCASRLFCVVDLVVKCSEALSTPPKNSYWHNAKCGDGGQRPLLYESQIVGWT